jgi:hypothetical protein
VWTRCHSPHPTNAAVSSHRLPPSQEKKIKQCVEQIARCDRSGGVGAGGCLLGCNRGQGAGGSGHGYHDGPSREGRAGLGDDDELAWYSGSIALHPGSVTLGSWEIRCTFELCVVDSGQWPHTASHHTVHHPLPVRLNVGCNVGCTRGWMSRTRCTLGRWIAASVHACSQQLGLLTLLVVLER